MEDAIRKARELLEIVGPYGLAEFEYTDGAVKIRFSRDGVAATAAPAAAAPAPVAAAPAPANGNGAAAPAPAAPAPAAAPPPAAKATGVAIRSPMVGTFYRSPAPDKPPYVREGDVVDQGQVVCIIEAMKLMNEIKSPARGRVSKILVDNSQGVSKDEVLFYVDPT